MALAATADPALIPQYIAATKKAQALEGAPGWKGRTRMTQAEKILEHLKKNGSITQREAYLDHGIQSFHRRLTDLKDAGYQLRGELRRHKVTGQEYTRYFLVGAA
ncbi:helix-turn-helix domain-containing protein [Mesorhizobium sp.]|uniref:helix-turn-helix domain-containing protein n=1 Tax=Mesorhizobium sp. TaxID=1871066 RepID=UPI000FEA5033|nr:helix-turn-helix domain-containing protein [Mesorhizobium sp.]RWM84323.1 MAG: hypothetical protein EOR83_17025 [Mesorhizobium sp.]